MSEQETKIPANHVVGVVSGQDQANDAIKALNEAGFDDNMVMSHVDAPGENTNPLSALVERLAGHLSEDVQFIEQYQEQTDQGRLIIAAKVEEPEDADRVREIMELNGAVNIRLFGRFAVSDLTPSTNPSGQSEESPRGPV
jgi:hypothetical protein